jgi:hypothetical protein
MESCKTWFWRYQPTIDVKMMNRPKAKGLDVSLALTRSFSASSILSNVMPMFSRNHLNAPGIQVDDERGHIPAPETSGAT